MEKSRAEILSACERDLYEEVYHFGDGGQSLVRDRVSGRVLLKKSLSLYSEDVYRYLMEHPNPHVPRVMALWKEDGRLQVVEELVSGYTLEYLLANDLLTRKEKKDVVLQLCDALTFLHRAEPAIIHRDIKASNVMRTDDGVVRLIDYDAAKTFDERQTRDTVLIGTRGSAAPEQYGFGKVDARTDVYGLGILMRELFPGDARLGVVADRAAELSPRDRYQSAAELKRAVECEGDVPAKQWRRFHVPWLPGFRSGNPEKMVPAALWYGAAFALSFSAGGIEQGEKIAFVWRDRLVFFLIFFSITDLYTNWTGFFRMIPLLRAKNKALRFLAYAACSAGAVLFWVVLLVGILPQIFS